MMDLTPVPFEITRKFVLYQCIEENQRILWFPLIKLNYNHAIPSPWHNLSELNAMRLYFVLVLTAVVGCDLPTPNNYCFERPGGRVQKFEVPLCTGEGDCVTKSTFIEIREHAVICDYLE